VKRVKGGRREEIWGKEIMSNGKPGLKHRGVTLKPKLIPEKASREWIGEGPASPSQRGVNQN